jgi:hypothetical protein
VAACIVAPLFGCSSSSSPKNTTTANILLKNENNYSSTSTLSLTSVDTAAGQPLTVDWSAVAADLQCHPLDPDPLHAVKNVALVWLPNMTQAQADVKLISGNLDLSTVGAYCEYNTPQPPQTPTTTATTSSMKCLTGDSRLPAQSDTDIYVLLASKLLTPGAGAQSMVFVHPTAASQSTTVNIPTGCQELALSADLHDLTKVAVPTQGPWLVDWSQVTQDSESKAVTWAKYDSYDLILGYYDNTVSEIETKFFDLDTLPKKIWKIPGMPGSSAPADMVKNLGSAMADDGSLFAGFDVAPDAVWALGLQCPDCQNPAPMFLTILDPIGRDQ